MKKLKGNLLHIKEGIICHQVNCMGKMGAGLALQIRKAYPEAYDTYMRDYREGNLKLGFTRLVKVTNYLAVANLCGQYYYGRDKCYTDYGALRTCLRFIYELKCLRNDTIDVPIYVPIGMGCSLAGGKWEIVEQIVNEEIPGAIIITRTL